MVQNHRQRKLKYIYVYVFISENMSPLADCNDIIDE